METPLKDNIEHPSNYLPAEITNAIRLAAGKAEGQRMLHNDQLDMIHKHQWLNMYVPKKYAGLELSIPDILRIEECLAWADGSTAWVVTLCSGAAWFSGFLDPGLASEVFADEHVCFAGSGAPTGTASITPTGYKINGYWKYASGSTHATVFTMNCLIRKDGIQLHHDDGAPVVRSFLLWRKEVTLHQTWNSMGMVATGTHSFEVKDLNVPEDRCFTIDHRYPTLTNPIFRYPFLQLAETTLAVNLSGMAARFLDLCEEFFEHKMTRQRTLTTNMPDLSQALSHATLKLYGYRQQFYKAVETSWNTCVNGTTFSQAELNQVSETSHTLARRSRQLIDDLYPYCGLAAADISQEINRVWRNIHTACQHALFTSRRLNDNTVL